MHMTLLWNKFYALEIINFLLSIGVKFIRHEKCKKVCFSSNVPHNTKNFIVRMEAKKTCRVSSMAEEKSDCVSLESKIRAVPWKEFHDALNASNNFAKTGWEFLVKHGFGAEPTRQQIGDALVNEREPSLQSQDAFAGKTREKAEAFRAGYLQLWESQRFCLDLGWIGKKIIDCDMDKVIWDCLLFHGVRCAEPDFEYLVFMWVVLYREAGLCWLLEHCTPAPYSRGLNIDRNYMIKLIHVCLQYLGYVPKINGYCSESTVPGWCVRDGGMTIDGQCYCTSFAQLPTFTKMMDWLEKNKSDTAMFRSILSCLEKKDIRDQIRAYTLETRAKKDRS